MDHAGTGSPTPSPFFTCHNKISPICTRISDELREANLLSAPARILSQVKTRLIMIVIGQEFIFHSLATSQLSPLFVLVLSFTQMEGSMHAIVCHEAEVLVYKGGISYYSDI